MSSASPETPSKRIADVFGSLGASGSDHARALDPLEDPPLEAVPQRGDAGSLGLRSPRRQSRRDAEPRDRHRVLGSGPPAPFLTAAGSVGRKRDALSHVERPGALGTVELVGRKREQVDAPGLDVDPKAARRLDRVGVEESAAPADLAREPGDRVEPAVLVVGGHDRHEHGPGPHGGEHPVRIQGARGLRVDRHDLEGPRFGRGEPRGHLPNRGVLGTGNDDAPSPAGGRAKNRQSIRLRAARGQDDLLGTSLDQPGDLVAGLLDDAARLLSFGVDGRGVSVDTRGGVHGAADLGIDRRRGVVVEVDHRFRISDSFKLSLRKPFSEKLF